MRGRYKGSLSELYDKTAVLVHHGIKPDIFLAKFDDGGGYWAEGWHEFWSDQFEIIDDEQEENPAVRESKAVRKGKKEWEPDTIAPELMSRKLREW